MGTSFVLVLGSVFQEDANLTAPPREYQSRIKTYYYDLIVHYTKMIGPLIRCVLSLYLGGYLTKQSGILPSPADVSAANRPCNNTLQSRRGWPGVSTQHLASPLGVFADTFAISCPVFDVKH